MGKRPPASAGNVVAARGRAAPIVILASLNTVGHRINSRLVTAESSIQVTSIFITPSIQFVRCTIPLLGLSAGREMKMCLR